MPLTLTRDRAHTLRDEASDFAQRCENALSFSRQYEDPDWKVDALEEALKDALEAKADWDRLLG